MLPANRSRPPAAYWLCQLGGWGAFFLANVFTSQGYANISWHLVVGYAVISGCGILLSHGFRWFVLRRNWVELPVRRLIPRVLATNAALSILLVAAAFAYFDLTGGSHLPARGGMALTAMVVLFTGNDFILFTVWSGIYFGFAIVQRQRRIEIENYQAKTALAEAELRGLKSQLNPHFLFNSLNSLRALVTEEPARAQEAITHLAGILRYHLQSGERSLVPLEEEIATVDQYLALELIRFEDRLTVERQIDAAALPCLVPPLAIQTLVENAVKYGVSRNAGANVIQLAARVTAGELQISVRNSGTLRETSGSSSTGVGLTNLRTRLRLLFADRATVNLREDSGGGVEARLLLPATAATGSAAR